MKKTVSCGDPKIRFKHQLLLQDYHELVKDTELKRRTLEMMKRKRETLIAEVKFLRRRYKHLKQEQSLETSSEMFRFSESSGKRKKEFGLKASMPCLDLKQKEALANDASCGLEKKVKRSRGNEVSTNVVTSRLDLDRDVSGFDLNQISRETEETEANGEDMTTVATKNAMLVGNGINEMKLAVCGDVEKGVSRVVKKVTWQDPVAISVGSF